MQLSKLHFFDVWIAYTRAKAASADYSEYSAELDRRIQEKMELGLSLKDALSELMRR